MWLRSTLEIGEAQPLSILDGNHAATTVLVFLCVNRSAIRYDFRGGAKALLYTVNIALTFIQFHDNTKFNGVLYIDEIEMNESEMMPSDSLTCMFVF